jgi:hypothetical protein
MKNSPKAEWRGAVEAIVLSAVVAVAGLGCLWLIDLVIGG